LFLLQEGKPFMSHASGQVSREVKLGQLHCHLGLVSTWFYVDSEGGGKNCNPPRVRSA
jgi:hypothetical protein